MDKNKFYKIKDEFSAQYLVENEGFDYLPLEITTDEIVCKVVKLPYESEMVQQLVEMYNSKKWQEKVLDDLLLEEEFKKIGIDFEIFYDEDGNSQRCVVENENFMEMVSVWRLEINFSDSNLLYFTTGDSSFPYSFYGKKILDEYCGDFIKELKGKGIIEETDVI